MSQLKNRKCEEKPETTRVPFMECMAFASDGANYAKMYWRSTWNLKIANKVHEKKCGCPKVVGLFFGFNRMTKAKKSLNFRDCFVSVDWHSWALPEYRISLARTSRHLRIWQWNHRRPPSAQKKPSSLCLDLPEYVCIRHIFNLPHALYAIENAFFFSGILNSTFECVRPLRSDNKNMECII